MEGTERDVKEVGGDAETEQGGVENVLQDAVQLQTGAGKGLNKRMSWASGMKEEDSPGKKAAKRRMSMKNRRVSFAPDPELTMIHTFVKDDGSSPLPPSREDGHYANEVGERGPREIGDITAGLPTLGELAEEEEEDINVQDVGQQQGYQVEYAYGSAAEDMTHSITAAVPRLGELLEEDELGGYQPENVGIMQGKETGMDDPDIMASPPVMAGPGSMVGLVSPGVLDGGHTVDESKYSPEIGGSEAGEGGAQENKWGFVPGTEDTLDMDLKEHGRMFMGDRTYNKVYADNVTMTTARGTPTAASLASVEILGEGSAEKSQQGGPNWNAPAFIPPYQKTEGQHPALHQSPEYTDSSINTVSTRRVSVDARRQSVSSRRMSLAPGPMAFIDTAQKRSVEEGNHTSTGEEEDLLAETPDKGPAKVYDVLAGLKNQMPVDQRLSPLDSTMKNYQTRPSLPLVPEEMAMSGDDGVTFKSPTAGAHILSKSPPPSATSGRRQSMASNGRRFSVISRDSIPARGTPGGSVSKSGMRTPVRSNALVPVGINPGQSNPNLAPPGSAIAARYPGSAIATGRLSQGFTPSRLAPITFQDFAKLVEVQFLDNLRRGASINYADLQPNSVPTNLKESYTLLCITSPNIAELETAIHTLQAETSRLRSSAADLEVMLGQTNPAIFRHVQTASYEQLEALRSNVAALKKACRAKATALLKDVRCQMEESKFGRLSRAVDGLKADLAWLQDFQRHVTGVAKVSSTFSKEQRELMAQKRKEMAQRRDYLERLAAARTAAQERQASNAERMSKLELAKSSKGNLESDLERLRDEKRSVEMEIEEARRALKNASILSSYNSATGKEVAEKLARTSLYESCTGMKVVSCSRRPGSLNCSVRVADIFQLDLTSQGNCFTANVGLGQTEKKKPSYHALAMALISSKEWCSFSFEKGAAVCMVQNLVTQLTRAAIAAKELHCIRSECKHICHLEALPAYSPSGTKGPMAVKVGFLGLKTGVCFSVTISIMDLICSAPDFMFGGMLVDKQHLSNVAKACLSIGTKDAPGLRTLCKALCNVVSAMESQMSTQNKAIVTNQAQIAA